MTATRYERVRYSGNGGQRRTVKLRITAETQMFLVGVEVDAEGCDVSGSGFDERVHMIEHGAIVKRTPLVLDLKYGTLEAAPR